MLNQLPQVPQIGYDKEGATHWPGQPWCRDPQILLFFFPLQIPLLFCFCIVTPCAYILGFVPEESRSAKLGEEENVGGGGGQHLEPPVRWRLALPGHPSRVKGAEATVCDPSIHQKV